MAVLQMCDCDDVDDHQQGSADGGVTYVVGDGQGDGLGTLRPPNCVYLVVLPDPLDDHRQLRRDLMLTSDVGSPRKSTRADMNGGVVGDGQGGDGLATLRPLNSVYLVMLPNPSDDRLHLRTGLILPSDEGSPTKSRTGAESATPPRHSHLKTGTNRGVIGDGESTCVDFVLPHLSDAHRFLRADLMLLIDGSPRSCGEEDEESTAFVDCFIYPADASLELQEDAGEMLGLLLNGETHSKDSFPTPKQLRARFSRSWELEVGFGEANSKAGKKLVRRPIIADEDVSRQFSLEHVLGWPMPQTVPGTCSLVSATVCLEARHRRVFEEKHGRGTFPCRAASPRKLRAACLRELYLDSFDGKLRRIWAPKQGADTARVLTKLKQLGGARTTNAPPPAPFFLPLADWTCYSYDEFLTQEKAAQLIREQGPCIGCLFSVPGYRREDREMLMKKDRRRFGMHALVCYAYRYTKRGKKLKIEVLDNGWPIGTNRWVDFEEFDRFFVLYVSPLPPIHLLGRSPPLAYPVQRFRL